MKNAFTPIQLDDYVEMHLRSNPAEEREGLIRRLKFAMDAARRGDRCHCGSPIWIVGSAQTGLSCFTCITGEQTPNADYEIEFTSR